MDWLYLAYGIPPCCVFMRAGTQGTTQADFLLADICPLKVMNTGGRRGSRECRRVTTSETGGTELKPPVPDVGNVEITLDCTLQENKI